MVDKPALVGRLKTLDAELARERQRSLELAAEARGAISNQTKAVVATALTLVSALFWQTAAMDAIKALIPVSGAWTYEVVVALLVTSVSAVIIYYLNKPSAPKPA